MNWFTRHTTFPTQSFQTGGRFYQFCQRKCHGGERYDRWEKDGRAHMLKSTCPHAGCEVRWNNAELSWDCPCHGSHFNINGRLLNAPSTIGLE